MDCQDDHSASLPCDFQGNHSPFLYIYFFPQMIATFIPLIYVFKMIFQCCLPISPKVCGLCGYTANHAYKGWGLGQ